MSQTLVDWTPAARAEFCATPSVARHRLHELPMWDDDSLVRLLDTYPRERLQAFTMGTDPMRRQDWAYVDAGTLGGKDLLRAVQHGRLWLNLLRAELADERLGDVQRGLEAEIKTECARLGLDRITFSTLLISSPEAMVYYHADGPHQALWHLRGRKRAWVYPVDDVRFAPRRLMEDIMVGAHAEDEELPYEAEFDQHAASFDLDPGQAVTWPQNAPHRITNLGTLNVSLVNGLSTAPADRKGMVFAANRYFGRVWRLPTRSIDTGGPSAALKCLAFRACRKAGLTRLGGGRKPYQARLRVDPDAPLGVRPL